VPLRALSSVVNTAASLSPVRGKTASRLPDDRSYRPTPRVFRCPILGECDAGYKWLCAVLK